MRKNFSRQTGIKVSVSDRNNPLMGAESRKRPKCAQGTVRLPVRMQYVINMGVCCGWGMTRKEPCK